MKGSNSKAMLPICTALLLAGCMVVGPDYSRPESPLPSSFGQVADGLKNERIEVEWWRVFDEPALTGLIQQALAANNDIAIAATRLEEAKAILLENRQDMLPHGGPTLDYEANRRAQSETPAGQAREIESYRTAADVAWEVDLFGRVRRSVEAAQAQVGSREALLRGVQASVAAAVAATWFELRGIESEQAVVSEISRNQRESLEMVERFISAGSAHEFDRLRAEALLHNVDSAAPELERRRAASSNALAILLGVAPQTFRAPVTNAEGERLKVRTISVGDPGGLLSRRADIMAAERNLAMHTAQIGIETAGLYPEVQISGSIGLVAGKLDALGNAGTTSSIIRPIISWSLLDRGRVRARIAASKARAQEALVVYDQAILSALQETDDAFTSYGAAGRVLELRLLEATANREAARLARLQFMEGEGIYLDVLEAERSDFTSRRLLSIARTNQRLAIVSIYKALGGGWEVCSQADSSCREAEDFAVQMGPEEPAHQSILWR
jgi:multidrug efflux system outer membrane protein